MTRKRAEPIFTIHRLVREGVCQCPVCALVDELEQWRRGCDGRGVEPKVVGGALMNAAALLMVREVGPVVAGGLLRRFATAVEDSPDIEKLKWMM